MVGRSPTKLGASQLNEVHSQLYRFGTSGCDHDDTSIVPVPFVDPRLLFIRSFQLRHPDSRVGLGENLN